MKKLWGILGLTTVSQSALDALQAVNAELKERQKAQDAKLDEMVGTAAKLRLELETLTAAHEQLKRGSAIMAKALEGRAMATLPKK